LKRSCKDDIIIEAATNLMDAKLHTAALATGGADFLNKVPSTQSINKSIDLPLELAVSSTRQIAGLIQYMFSEKRADSVRSKGQI
jgi:hypothetical protein